MYTSDNYQIADKIYESDNSAIYRGLRNTDNKPVVLKKLNRDFPTPIELARFRREFKIASEIRSNGIIKVYNIEKFKKTLMIVMEDFGGESVNRFLPKTELSIKEKLIIAIKISEYLGQIHLNNVIHMDINPSNIVWNPQTDMLKMIDFGISTKFANENPEIKNPDLLEGTLPYISPEQTGRMNRSIDYRTDLYSLGVTLYEISTGKLPFYSDDNLEIIHAHIAKTPMDPREIDRGIPGAMAEIIMKLMAKDAEDRYQSAAGVKYDLENCLTQLEESGQIKPFIIGSRDVGNKFQIPQKLYGRKSEIADLISAFRRVNKGEKEILFIKGPSGIGKSALVGEIHKHIVEEKGYFISGKLGQLERDIPYLALKQAFQSLARQILSESKENLDDWRKRILDAAGPNGQVIIEAIPEFELIIGRQPEVPTLPPKETDNRFNKVFADFVKVFGSQKHPIVIFIDDLQWSDKPTLKLIKKMLDGAETGLLIIGAYRDDEIDGSHALNAFLKKRKKLDARVNTIELRPLSPAHTDDIISETLKCDAEKIKKISGLCHSKAKGNPLFLKQLLESFYHESLIQFDASRGEWGWDIKAIEKFCVTDNVMELMMSKIRKLSETSQQMIKLAACIGNRFSLETLAVVTQKTPLKTAEDFSELILEGLIIASDDYKYLDSSEKINVDFWFFHDRVRQAAYGLIEDEVVGNYHLTIGRRLQEYTVQNQKETVFEIVKHLNKGKNLIADRTEKENLARLNLLAAKKAKTSAAWQSAFDFLMCGLTMLEKDSWQTQYDLTLALYVEAAEAAYLNNHQEKADALSATVLNRAKTLLDKCSAYEIKINNLIAQGKPSEAVDLGLSVLSKLGVKFPKTPHKINLLSSTLKTRWVLKRKIIDKLYNQPKMTDLRKLAAAQILMTISSSAYVCGSKHFVLITIKLVDLFITHGYFPQAAYGCVVYATILCAVLSDYDLAYKLAQLALRLSENIDAKAISAKVVYVANAGVKPWIVHYKKIRPSLSKYYQIGLEIGDFEFAAYNVYAYCYMQFLMGAELDSVNENMTRFGKKIANQETQYNYFKVYHQTVLNIMGKSNNPCVLTGDMCSEKNVVRLFEENKNKIGLFEVYSNKLFLCYFFENYDEVIKLEPILEKILPSVVSKHNVATVHFYHALTFCAIFKKVSKSKQKAYLKKIRSKIKKMDRWAFHAPENYKHKLFLMKAELSRVVGENRQAADNYHQAIETARVNGFVQEEALCYELAAKWCLNQNENSLFELYIKEAHTLYDDWGAVAKCNLIEKNYPDCFSIRHDKKIKTRVLTSRSGTFSNESATVDLWSTMKMSQVISSEIDLNRLLNKFLQIVTENAGAQCGYLVLKEDGGFVIKASYSIDDLKENELPEAIINYVVRTKENIVLGDASQNGDFSQDNYIRKVQPKSVLCMPMTRKDVLAGILYLENNQVANAFTKDRIEFLRILSSQASISIENARLYEMAKKSENRYRSIFENATDGIFQVDPDWREVLAANQAIADILGYRNPDDLKREIKNIWKDIYADKKIKQEFKEKIEENGFVKDFETKLRCKNSMIITVLITAHAVYGEHKKILHYEGTVKDITKKKEIETLRLKKEAAEAKSKAKSQFLANMSHEIRTPLNTLLGYSELLKDDIDEEQRTKYIENIISSGRLLLSIINDILDFSKIEKGKISLDLHPMSIFAALKEIEKQFSSKIAAKGLKFDLKIEPAIKDLVIKFDEVRFKQILINLIGNAVKYTHEGYIKVSIHKVPRDNNPPDLRVIVKDSGTGMADTKNIFKEFEQLSQPNGKMTGAGLGLAIVKRIVSMLNGTISVESKPGEGSEFTILFENIEVVKEIDEYRETLKKDRDENIVFEPATMIVVDDNSANRRLILDYLKHYNIHVVTAKDGQEATKKAQKLPADIILMDLKMPVMDGFQATKIIKSKLNIPIVALTADITEESKREIESSGCDGFLLKPVSRQSLLIELKRFLPCKDVKEEGRAGTKKTVKSEPVSFIDGLLDNDNMDHFPDILAELKKIKKERWVQTNKTMIIRDVEEFANEIKNIGVRYGHSYLSDWGDSLCNNARDFNIDMVEQMLKQYPSIISHLDKQHLTLSKEV